MKNIPIINYKMAMLKAQDTLDMARNNKTETNTAPKLSIYSQNKTQNFDFHQI
jgi:hypothetical protein